MGTLLSVLGNGMRFDVTAAEEHRVRATRFQKLCS